MYIPRREWRFNNATFLEGIDTISLVIDPFGFVTPLPLAPAIITRPTMHYEPFQTVKWPARGKRKNPKAKPGKRRRTT